MLFGKIREREFFNAIQPCLFLRLVRSVFLLEGKEFLMIEILLVAGLSSGQAVGVCDLNFVKYNKILPDIMISIRRKIEIW